MEIGLFLRSGASSVDLFYRCNFKARLVIVEFVLKVQIREIESLFYADIADIADIKYESPLIQCFTKQGRSVFRFCVDWDSNNCIVDRDVLSFSKLLFDFNELVFSHD